MREKWAVRTPARLPQALLEHETLGLSSLKQARKLLDKGVCRVNNVVERCASRSVHPGDHIEVTVTKPSFKESLHILYEDEWMYGLYKPSGLAVELSSFEALLQKKLFLVHRLDKETSGILLAAKNRSVQKALEEQFRSRLIEKEYLAVVDGVFSNDCGTVDAPLDIKRTKEGRVHVVVATGGVSAHTSYKVIAQGKNASFLLLKPTTGRTHQLRVHMAALHHPILGDSQYASSFLSSYYPARHLLHAWRIRFSHPILHSNQLWTANIPRDMLDTLYEIFGYTSTEGVLCDVPS